jgi:hypothetical protein
MAIGRRKDSASLGKWSWDFAIGKSIFEDRVYVNGGWESQQQNIENDKFRGLFDLQNLEVGWIAYLKGEGLNAKLVRIGKDYDERPSDKHTDGLRLVIKTDESLGGDLRELISTSSNIWSAIDQLHDDYLAGAGDHPGCLPAVDIVDVHKEGTQNKSLLVPVFKIAGWQPRPYDLPAAGIPLVRRLKKASDSEQTNGSSDSEQTNGSTRPRVQDALNDEIPF